MTREEAKRRAELYSALAEGKAIQVQNPVTSKWEYLDINKIGEFMEELNYRIKPEPKYRPFKTQEECWNEMHKHPDFGWVKKINGGYKQIMAIHIDIFNKHCADFAGQTGTACFGFEYIYNNYTFVDGTPFGIKEE